MLKSYLEAKLPPVFKIMWLWEVLMYTIPLAVGLGQEQPQGRQGGKESGATFYTGFTLSVGFDGKQMYSAGVLLRQWFTHW